MGARIRKSINLGCGVRINISKSGIGYSWGVPGYRITKTASGKVRETYSIPGTGISYVGESSSGKSIRKIASYKNNSYEDIHDVESADISNFQSLEYEELLKKIRSLKRWATISTWMIVCLIFLSPVSMTIAIIGIAIKIYLRLFGRIEFFYDFDAETRSSYNQVLSAWHSVNNCEKIWQIKKKARVQNTKNSGGATSAAEMTTLSLKFKTPWYFKTNVQVVSLPFEKETIYMLPDKFLIYKNKKFGAIDYKDIKCETFVLPCVSDEKRPADAKILRYTWLYVNKDGSPDKRHKGNKQLPVYKYGMIKFTSSSGLDASVICSNVDAAEKFEKAIENFLAVSDSNV